MCYFNFEWKFIENISGKEHVLLFFFVIRHKNKRWKVNKTRDKRELPYIVSVS